MVINVVCVSPIHSPHTYPRTLPALPALFGALSLLSPLHAGLDSACPDIGIGVGAAVGVRWSLHPHAYAQAQAHARTHALPPLRRLRLLCVRVCMLYLPIASTWAPCPELQLALLSHLGHL